MVGGWGVVALTLAEYNGRKVDTQAFRALCSRWERALCEALPRQDLKHVPLT